MPADSSLEGGDAQRDQMATEAKGADTPATAASASPTDAQAGPVAPAVASGTTIPSASELAKMLRGGLCVSGFLQLIFLVEWGDCSGFNIP